MKKFKQWLKMATKDERLLLASLADTHSQMFYKFQYEKENGGRTPSSELAGRIENAVAVINRERPERGFPVVTRADLSPVCAKCPYFRAGSDE